VRTLRAEELLALHEQRHVCDPVRVYQIAQGALPWRATSD
jgi:hypothetical protein